MLVMCVNGLFGKSNILIIFYSENTKKQLVGMLDFPKGSVNTHHDHLSVGVSSVCVYESALFPRLSDNVSMYKASMDHS